MAPVRAPWRCAALAAFALVTPAVVVTLFFNGPASAQGTTVEEGGIIYVTVPDNTFGQGGTRMSGSDKGYKLLGEEWKDKDGALREVHISNDDDKQRQRETWAFYDPRDRSIAGFIEIRRVPGSPTLWSIEVSGRWSSTPSLTDAASGRTPIRRANLTRDTVEKEAAFWESQLRFWSNGAVGPVRAGNGPDYGRADSGTLPPDTGYAVGPRPPQQQGPTVQCFGDIACERALAANRGETNLDFGKSREGRVDRDDRKDDRRPLYERPDLPRNALPYDVPQSGLPYGR